jgi:PAT family beta-lactamase induction signal transducer AmpG
MQSVLSPPPGAKPPSVGDFTKHYGPWIVTATVLLPLAVAATTNWLRARGKAVLQAADTDHSASRTVANHLYAALVAPLAELAGRLGWGVSGVIGMILTYTLCYNIWGSFAFPFYLEFLKYSKDEVAFASKVFGILMTMAGIGLGGYLFARLGRMPTILVGAVLPVLGNFVYADLAEGGHYIDAVCLPLFGWTGLEPRIIRLLAAIAMENVSTGIAGAAFVAYLSGIVSKSYTAVQYALLSSLTFLIGGLGRGIAGEAIDSHGYAFVFRWTAAAGALAIVFVLMEWARAARQAKASPETPD